MGSSGTVVFSGELQGRPVAVKRMLLQFYEDAQKELNLILQTDTHPNIIRFHFQDFDKNFVYLVYEKCDLNLSQFLCLHQNTSYQQHLRILSDICNGIQFLHSLNICHRDIKPENILINIGKNTIQSKIADMAASKQLQSSRFSSLYKGSIGWQPVEVLKASDDQQLNPLQ